MNGKRIRAYGVAGALVGWSFTAGIEQPWRRHPVTQAALGTALAAAFGAQTGLRPPALRAGLRSGVAVAGAIAFAVALSTTLPRVRAGMGARVLPQRPGRWLGIEIPLGGVEEHPDRVEEVLPAGPLGRRQGRLDGDRRGVDSADVGEVREIWPGPCMGLFRLYYAINGGCVRRRKRRRKCELSALIVRPGWAS